jgi:hypothetical protein
MKCFYNIFFSRNWLAIGFVGAWLVCSLQANAQVVLSATSTGSGSNASSVIINHTTAAGSNRLMVVGISAQQPASTTTSVTYNGVNLTKLNAVSNASQTRVEIWYLVAPPVGNYNLTVNLLGSDNSIVGVQTFTGVNQATPFGTFVSATGASTTATVNASSAAGELVYGVVGWNNGNLNTIGAGQTEYWDMQMNSSISGAGSTEAGAATVTMSWTNAGAQPWSIAAVPMRAAPAPAPGGVSTNNTLWLKADAGTSSTTDGATVTTWTNSAPGAQVSTAALGLRPLYRISSSNFNYNPLLDFDGVDDFFAATSNFGVTGTSLFTAFVVSRRATDTTSDMFFGGSTSANNCFGFHVFSNDLTVVEAQNIGTRAGTNATALAGVGNIKGFNRTASNNWQLYHNGATDGTAGGIAAFGGTFGSSNLNIGAGHGTQADFDGDIAEIVIHSGSLTAAEMNRIQSYLAIKYGISLDQTVAQNYVASDGTVIWNGTTNSVHKNNITGIGRDDLSALNQKQSKSINTASSGDLVAMGLGAIAANNAANANTFSADRNFMVWGDDGGANAWQTTESPTARQRLTREWRVQETGTVGSVLVRVQDDGATSGGELPTETSTVYLLVDADGDFSSGATETAMTLTGTNWEVSYNFTNGQFFTFATVRPTAPGGVLGASIWLRANTGVTTGATFTWADQSGNNRNGVQASAANQPLLAANTFNFNPTLSFDGTSDFLSLQNLAGLPTGAAQVEEFAVARNLNTAGGWQHILNYGNNINQQAFGLSKNQTNANAVAMGYGVDAISSSLEFNNGNLALLDGKYNGTQLVISSFGVQRATFATSLSFGTSVGYVGVDPAINSATHWNGNISEIILYSTNLTAGQAQQVNSYLAIKYGITLDQTSPQNYLASDASVIWNGTTNSGYRNNIAGIGRDDLSDLNQKQSRSVNTAASGNLVTMGLGTIAADNAANPNSFPANRNFLIWGDNNGANAWQSTEAPVNRQRLTREWRVQETGTIGNVRLQVPDNSGAGLPAEATTVYLLVDADGDFSSGATEIAMTLNGTNWEVNVDFTNGQFFTFATQRPNAPGGVLGSSIWLKANTGVTTGATFTWADQSGNSRNGVQSTAANQPLLISSAFNFNPGLLFDGTNDHLSLQNLTGLPTGAAQVEAFSVANNLNIASPWSNIFTYGTGSLSQMFGLAKEASTTNTSTVTWGNDAVSTFGEFAGGRPALLNGKYTGTQVVISSFGVQRATQTSTNNKTTSAGSVGAYPIPSSGAYWNGNIPEIILYPTNLSAGQVQQVNSYLAIKYGITLDQTAAQNYLASDASVIWNGTTNSGYKSNITGIGRDDLSALNQKQSRSVNTASAGNLVTMGLGIIAVDNASNSNTFPADKNFLVWGDDLGSTAVQTTDSPNNSCGRMTRIFKVQETGGEVGNLAVNFDLSTLSATYGAYAASGLTLVVSSSASFATPLRSYTASSYTAGIVSFSGVDLDNGEFFTLAVRDVNFIPSVSSNSPVCAESAFDLMANGGTTYSWAGPNGFTSTLRNPQSPSIQFADAGTYSVTISNSFGCRAVMTTNVVVDNCAPAVCVQTICNTSTATGSITATDADGDALTNTITQNAANGTFAVVGTNYTYTPTAGFVGEDQVTIQSCDPSGACVLCVKKFVVQACNIAPVCGTSNTLTTCMGTAASGTLNATAPNGLPITYTIVSQPTSGTVSLVGAVYTYTPVQGFEGSVVWVYRATTATGSIDCRVTIYLENCFSYCDGNGCSANLISGGTYPTSGSSLFSLNNVVVASNTSYCYSITLTNQCAACPTTAKVNFYAGTVLLGTINYDELPLNVATVKGFSFNTAQLGNPASINLSVTHVGFGTPGTNIVAANASLKIITAGGVPEANNDAGILICKNSGSYTAAVLSNDLNVSGTPTLTLITALPGTTGTASVVGQNIVFTPNASFVGTANITYQICNGACCDQAVLTIDVVDPAVSVSPITICQGASASLLATVTGIDASFVTYQWQSSSNNTTFNNIAGARSSSYTLPWATAGTTFYRCIISASGNGCGSVTSSSATVVVNVCTEICENGIDDDGDELIDCNDPDCAPSTLSSGAAAATFRTIAHGAYSSAATWAGGNIPGYEDINGQTISIEHHVHLDGNGLKLLGNAKLFITNGSLILNGGNLIIEDGTIALQKSLLKTAASYNIHLTTSQAKLYAYNSTIECGQNFQSSEGKRVLQNVCMTVLEVYDNSKGTDSLTNVCAKVGMSSSGNFINYSDSEMYIKESSFELPNGNFQNQSNADLSGSGINIWVKNGNLQNDGNWTAAVADYCVSGAVTVASAYLPGSENCGGIATVVAGCNCACSAVEICTNGIDDDGDGLTDCDDPDCYLASNSGGTDTDGDGIVNSCDMDDDNDGITDANECQALVSLDFLDGACRLNGTVISSLTALNKNDILTFSNLATLGDGTVVDGKITINHIGRGLNYNPSSAHFELTPYEPTLDDYLMFTLELFDAGSLNIIPFKGQMVFRDIDSQENFDFTELLGIKQNHTVSLGSNLQLRPYQNGGGPANHTIYGLNPATAGVVTNWVDEVNASPSDINYWVTADYETVTQLEVSYGVTGTSGNGSNARDLYISSSFQILDVCDLDGDGIANQLDLDTDGDGCPDAIEGSANFTPAHMVASSMNGGNSGGGYTGSSSEPIIHNLGNAVATSPASGALGIPTIAGNGQGVGDSQNGAIQSSDCSAMENCTNGIDDDGDGLVDGADPDCCTAGGNAVAVVSQTGVTNAPNAVGVPNGTAAELFDNSDVLMLDLGTTIPAGGQYKLVWRRKASYTNTAVADIIIEEGQTASAFTQNPAVASTTERTVYIETIITANVPTRYLRLRIQTNTDDDAELDAVQIVSCGSEICINGIDDDGDGLTDCDDADCNLITNGEFNAGTTGWQLHVQAGNTATLSVANTSQLSGVNSGLVDLTTASGTEWHVQLAQHGKSIVAGQAYTVSFQARAAANRNASVTLQRTTSPFNTYWYQTFALTTSAQSFSYTFVADSTNTGLVGLYFNLAANNTDVWIDNVKFTRSCAPTEICGNGIDDDGDGSIDSNDPNCFACSNGVLSNPDFNANFTDWYTWYDASIVQEANGNKYAHIDTGGGGVSRDYPATPGSTYSLLFKARTSETTDWAWGGFIFLDAAYNAIGYHQNSRLNTTNFAQYQMAAVAPAGTAFIRVAAWKDPGTGTTDLDGFCLSVSTENCSNGIDDDADGLVDCNDPSCPCSNRVAVGNVVFIDADNDKIFDAGEGVNGVQVRLFRGNDNPLVATPIATTTTANGGKYLFDNLAPGEYMVFIPPSEFAAGKPLFNRVSVDGFDGDYGNDDENSENGLDNPNPAVYGLSSGKIGLFYNSEPVTTGTELGHDNTSDDANDPSDDNNTDLTIDFGFVTTPPCSMTISQAKATPCYKNGSGNYVTDIELTVYWAGFIDGDTIRVSMNGITDQFAPFNEYGGIIGNGVQHFFLRGVPAAGGSGTVNAQFLVRTGCAATKSVALPNCNCPTGQLAGTAWQDFNNSGTQEAHETAGVAGVTVMAYDCTGALVGTTTTNATGQFTFTGLTDGDKYRIEFSAVPAPYFSTEMGVSNGSNVQFVTSPSCVINFGVNNPDFYCQDNPLVGVPCYVNGLASAPGVAAHDAFVFFPYEATATYDRNTAQIERTAYPTHASTIGEIGSTWGVAYQRSTKTMFTSAVIKRHAGLGPLGTGGIYKINAANPAAPTTANWIDVKTLGVDTGTDPRDGTPGNTLPTATTSPSYDIKAYDAVGKKGIGDLDYDEARNTLWFVNLYERTLVGIRNVNPSAAPIAANLVEYPISLPAGYSCGTNGELRPWGLKVHEGRVYVGIICTNQGPNWWDATGLRAYVVSFNPDSPASGFRYETDFDMSYDKVQFGTFKYNNWVPSVAHLDYGVGYTTPILSDIEFDLDGSMMLGIADRLGLQVGYYNYAPDETMTDQALHAIAQSGDLLRLCKVGNSYVLPGSDPACPLLGVVHGDGINGGEHYWADWGPHIDQQLMADYGFNETAMGAIAFNRSAGEVISTQTDPTVFYSGGVMTYNNVTGGDMNAYTLYVGVDDGGQGKATGLGDIELLCNLQPIELGNYVWLDQDDDGVQDACEPPLDSVRVSLYKPNGLLIGQTTTDAFGNYRFNETNVDTLGFLNDNIWTGLSANANYVIVVGNVSNNGVVFANGKLRVNGIDAVLTFPNLGEGANPDLNDSDGTILSGLFFAANGFPGVVTKTPAKGSLHNQDFGFRPLCENFSVFAGTDVTICNGTSANLTATGYGGLQPHSFAWSNGLGNGATKVVSPVATTTYSVTITDADGCISTDQVTVTVTNCTEICADGQDNDGDGLIDCADPDCAAVGQPNLANDIYQTCPGLVFREQPIFNDGNIQFPVYSINTQATKGSVTINTQGVFTYTPFNSACGVDSFKYQVCNALTGCCDQATVVLQVGDNLPPTLQNLPADVTIACGDPIPVAPTVIGLDACPGIYISFDETSTQGSGGSCQNYQLVRTWTAYDKCGNYSTGVQRITVADEVEPEIFRVYTMSNGKKLLAGIAEKVKTTWTRVKFPIAFNDPPLVFAQATTANGAEPITIRVKDVDEEGFLARVQEQEQADGIHAIEQISWMAVEAGVNQDAARLQVGLATGMTNAQATVNYATPYTSEPVLLAFGMTNNEADPFSIRFQSQAASNFRMFLDEEQSNDAEKTHAAEAVAWLAMNAGTLLDKDGGFVGHAGKATIGNAWTTINLPKRFSKPVVLFGGQPAGNAPATIRVRNITANSFQVRIEEWPYLNNIFPARPLSFLVVEGSLPAAIDNPCSLEEISLLPGINIFAVDDCDNQVTIDYTKSSALTPAGLVHTNVWVAADDCGNANTLIRKDTCDMAAVRVKALLGGGLVGVPNSTLMRDKLREKRFLPSISPYWQSDTDNTGNVNFEAIPSSYYEITGPTALVDWVLVELRDPVDPTKVLGAKSALLLRNGTIIGTDGSDVLVFDTTSAGDYYVSLKHRNHLGIMSAHPKYLDAQNIPLLDFTSLNEPLYGSEHAQRLLEGTRMLWSGDLNSDGKVIYQGPTNDAFSLFYDIMTHPDNTSNLANFIRSGYEDSDVNLDGNAIYQGPTNDRAMLLQHTILVIPTNSLKLSNYIAYSLIP